MFVGSLMCIPIQHAALARVLGLTIHKFSTNKIIIILISTMNILFQLYSFVGVYKISTVLWINVYESCSTDRPWPRFPFFRTLRFSNNMKFSVPIIVINMKIVFPKYIPNVCKFSEYVSDCLFACHLYLLQTLLGVYSNNNLYTSGSIYKYSISWLRFCCEDEVN